MEYIGGSASSSGSGSGSGSGSSSSSFGLSGFVKAVFRFDDETKSDLLNMGQFLLFLTFFLGLLNVLAQRLIPDASDGKSSVELTVELLLQSLFLFFAMYYVLRVIRYIPTYSEAPYPDLFVISMMVPLLFALFRLDAKFRDKITILWERVVEAWEGRQPRKKKVAGGGGGTESMAGGMDNNNNNNNNNNGGTSSLSSLPMAQPTAQPPVDFNNMYKQYGGSNNNNNNNNKSGGGEDAFVPVAANSVLGGGFGAAF